MPKYVVYAYPIYVVKFLPVEADDIFAAVEAISERVNWRRLIKPPDGVRWTDWAEEFDAFCVVEGDDTDGNNARERWMMQDGRTEIPPGTQRYALLEGRTE